MRGPARSCYTRPAFQFPKCCALLACGPTDTTIFPALAIRQSVAIPPPRWLAALRLTPHRAAPVNRKCKNQPRSIILGSLQLTSTRTDSKPPAIAHDELDTVF